jgi:hypothetical protein
MAMKTTIDIADPVLHEAKKLAAREGTTLRALVEEGLRQAMAERRQRKRRPYRQRLVVFRGNGLTPEFRNASWAEVIEASHERGERGAQGEE